jgi:hypothetical protein
MRTGRRRLWKVCARRGAGASKTLKRFRTVCLVLSLFLCVLFLVRNFTFSFASSESDSSSAIAQTEQRIEACYSAAADAAKAGANVTSLLTVLDGAGMNLSLARVAFQDGNFDYAYALAVQSNATLNGFEAQAASLRDTAAQQRYVDFAVNVVGSTVGTFTVIIIGLVIWFGLKRRPEKSGKVA